MQEVLQEPAEVAAAKKDLCEIAHRFSEERPSKGLWASRSQMLLSLAGTALKISFWLVEARGLTAPCCPRSRLSSGTHWWITDFSAPGHLSSSLSKTPWTVSVRPIYNDWWFCISERQICGSWNLDKRRPTQTTSAVQMRGVDEMEAVQRWMSKKAAYTNLPYTLPYLSKCVVGRPVYRPRLAKLCHVHAMHEPRDLKFFSCPKATTCYQA